jgi:competence protein ComEC
MEILSLFAGTAFFFTKSVYPLLGLMLIFLFKTESKLKLNLLKLLQLLQLLQLLLWFLAGFLWACLHQSWYQDKAMPGEQLIPKANLRGRVASIPVVLPSKTQFKFLVQTLDEKPVQALVLMSCYQRCPAFKLGELWELEAKLKRPKNLRNPGHFDYQGGLNARHIYWTAYINGKRTRIAEPKPINHINMAIDTIRASVSEKLEQIIPDRNTYAIIEALTLGLTGHMDKTLWDLFRRTGTTHLMVISGAHISLVAGIAYWLFKKMWGIYPRLCLFAPAQISAGLFAVLVAFAYALLAGFAPPAQRALVACAFVMLCHLFGRRFTPWQSWRYALLLIILWEPHVVLFPGFYLSFLAVATLISASQRIRKGGITKAIGLQFACLFGLMPMTLYWFSYAAITGVVANAVAIPLVGYLLVPLSLLFVLLSVFITGSNWFSILIEATAKLLLGYLHWIDRFSYLNLSLSFSDLRALFALMLAFMLMFFIPNRAFLPVAIVLILSAFSLDNSPRQLQANEAQIDVLDVGQGLSVVITTANHTLVYDTGMKFFQGSDMAQMAIIPYLETRKIHKIDMVIISHPDLDHRGGLASLEKKYPVGVLVVNQVSFYHRGQDCHRYPAWNWDGIDFRFFPIKTRDFKSTNNYSCVLQVSNQAGRLLLTGDIEAMAEAYLLKHYASQLKSEVLVVPHHGSKTSSTIDFIHAVSPAHAIISAGFDNRYHFPHQKTLDTFTANKVKLWDTMDCGMVRVKLAKNKPIEAPSCHDNG